MPEGTKTIIYRGGVVEFEIPSHWKEEYDPKGGGTFYEDRPDSGTLRLNVLGFSNTTGQSSEAMLQDLAAQRSYDALKCGLPGKCYVSSAKENGVDLSLYRWEIAVPVPPDRLRVAIFTYTIVAGQEREPRIKAELDLVATIVESAKFSREQGVTGDYHQ